MEPNDAAALSREQRLDEVIAEYLNEVGRGEDVDREAWIQRYPEFADDLVDFFRNQDQVEDFVGQMRDPSATTSFFERTTHVASPTETKLAEEFTEIASEFARDAVDRYTTSQLHAQGGMGEVWVATDEWIGRKVALKRLLGDSTERQRRFLAEVRVTGALEHPGIVPLHDVGVDAKGQPYYIMKFVEGETLRDRIREFHELAHDDPQLNLRLAQLLRAFVDVCHAVSFAHSRGVLHRDLKPANVMIGSFGETVVLDWGLAKVIDEEDFTGNGDVSLSLAPADLTKTNDGAILGSPAYMAPEAASGRSEQLDERTDIYLLGATLYEILTGSPPRTGGNPYDLLEQTLFKSPAPPRSVKGSIARPLDAICQKAIAFKKEDRYQSAKDLAEDVEKFLAGEPVGAYVETFEERVGRWCRRNYHRIRLGVALTLLTAVTLFAFSYFRENARLRQAQLVQTQWREFNQLADEAQFFAASVDPVIEAVPYYEPSFGASRGLQAIELAEQWGEDFQHLPAEQRPAAKATLSDLALVLLQTNLHKPVFEDAAAADRLLARLQTLDIPKRSEQILSQRYAGKADGDEPIQIDGALPLSATDHFLAGENYRLSARNPKNPTFGDEASNRQRGVLEQAVAEYERALALKPDHYWALLQLGRCKLSLGKTEEAIAILQGCVTLRPEAPWGYLARGVAFCHLGDYDRAIQELDRLDAVAPGFEPSKLHRAVVGLLSGKLDQAEPALQELASKPAFQAPASFYLGELNLQRREFAKAREYYSQAVSDLATPNIVYERLATTSFLLGEHQQGLDEMKRCYPDAAADARGSLARAEFIEKLSLRADPTSRVRKDLAALQFKEIQQAYQKGAESADLIRHAGSALERLGMIKEALNVYSQGLTVDPNHEKLRLQRGWIYVAMNNWSEAAKDFEAALATNKASAEAHTGLGYVHACTKSVPKAEDAAVQAVLFGERQYLVLHNVACIYSKLSQANPQEQDRYLDLAMHTLTRAFDLWEKQGRGEPNELQLALQESAFTPAMRARPDFQGLTGQAPAKP